jgi:hypothetical protein
LSLSLSGLSGFQWQHSLECLDLLHWPQITSIYLPSLFFYYLVGGSNNFWYSLASPILSSQVTTIFLCSKKVSLFIPTITIQRYACKHAWKKVVKRQISFPWCWRQFVSFNIHS